ncbi:MAG: PIG-L domain-containing protein [Cyanobacteria bacterium 13_1_20CM_4_61_6]|nr:MAG: PIG-L domain-containing protein [Cyanobacteria bacterium 13_1_20CM_4_61_6]
MLPLRLAKNGTDAPLQVLCLGAHSDDIEIGCGGTVLRLAATVPRAEFTWVVLSGDATRAEEARRSAALFVDGTTRTKVVVKEFRDGFFPYAGAEIKDFFEALKREAVPDIIFTHYRGDHHQDHRLVSELTWNTFRDHLILEYEVPKYDGDLGRPNWYVPLDERTCHTKTRHLVDAFVSQRDRRWFTEETFRALMRLRGVECAAPDGYAEAFFAHKLSWLT